MKDLSGLPRGNGRTGLLPDAEPRFIGVLVEKWAAEADDDKPTAHGTPFRHSSAGKCARNLAYAAAGFPKTDPMDVTGVWNTTLGTHIHEWWQAALAERYPDAEIEPKVRTVGADGSGHIDAVIRTDDKVIMVELKTVGGYSFKSSIGVARRGTPAEGPSPAHICQAALNALAVDADEAIVAYISKEAVGMGIAKSNGLTDLDRIVAEWTYQREEFEPIAQQEAARVTAILNRVAGGELAPRRVPGEMPVGAEIIDPARSAWTLERNGVTEQTGSVWNGQHCLYCPYFSGCSQTEPGIIPIADAMGVFVEMTT